MLLIYGRRATRYTNSCFMQRDKNCKYYKNYICVYFTNTSTADKALC